MRATAVTLVVLAATVLAQGKYVPDPIVRYRIEAQLDAAAKTVKGHEVIIWRNHSAEQVPDLQFHLYLNAFKNNLSTFMRESGGTHRAYRFGKRPGDWGYQQISSLKVNGEDLTGRMHYIQPDDGNPHDQTVLRVALSRPVPANGSVSIEITWVSKLPRVFSRTGFQDNFFLVAQWFPKPCVYEAKGERHRAESGWNCHQFHLSSEFYADYGIYDVSLTVPSEFEIAATGGQRSRNDNGNGIITYNYYQEDVHDFAWTTQPRSQVIKATRSFKADEQVSAAEYEEWAKKTSTPLPDMRLQDVSVTVFLQREHAEQLERHFRAAFESIKWFGLFYGKYPYDVLTVVDPPFNAGGAGGMEYPTFITAGTDYIAPKLRQDPEGVTVHEFGHQFWYGLIGNNEFEEAWLDEGLNTYSTGKVLERAYGPNYEFETILGVPIPGRAWVDLPIPRYPWNGIKTVGLGPYWEWIPDYQRHGRAKAYSENAESDAMQRFAWQMLNRQSYSVQSYSKPELTFRTLEAILGDHWHRAIRAFQQRYRFRHPDAIDFVNTIQEVSGHDLKLFFDQTIFGTGTLNYSVSFTTGHAPSRRGMFDKDGRLVLVEEKERSPAIESEVVVQRLAEMRFPVTVLVKFEDGSQVREQWDGQYRWRKFKYLGRPKIVSAQLEPEWALDIHHTNNSALAEPVRLAAEKWYLRWVYWIQNVLMAFSFFS